jgi:hypothetical protein
MRKNASMNDVGSDVEGIKLQYIFKRIDQLSQCISGKVATQDNNRIHELTKKNLVLEKMYTRVRGRTDEELPSEYFKPMMKSGSKSDVNWNKRHLYNDIVSSVREDMVISMVEKGKIPFVTDLRAVLQDFNTSSKTWKSFFKIPSSIGTEAKKKVNKLIKEADAVWGEMQKISERGDTTGDVVRENGMLIKDRLISGELKLEDAPAVLERFELTDGGTTADMFEEVK